MLPGLMSRCENAVFMRIKQCGRASLLVPLRDGSIRSRADRFVQLAAFHQPHAEVTRAVALADLIDRDNAWMVEAGGSFRFEAKAL